ncbi:MAG: hypothetical protein JHC93_04175 [Parachlamydiales bacterium]|nr:hypothetical protein [Parachlamydiales bacterium]
MKSQTLSSACIQSWLKKLGNLMIYMDPKMQGDPLCITNTEFPKTFLTWEAEAKKLLHLLEYENLSKSEHDEVNQAYMWLNFCQEMYDAYVRDPEIMAEEPGFQALERALENEALKPLIRKFLDEKWNQAMPNATMTHAQCYALLCKTMGENAKYTQDFVKSIASDLSDIVSKAIDCEYKMSAFPAQLTAYLNQHSIESHYRNFWYEKGKDPERIKEMIGWIKKKQGQ